MSTRTRTSNGAGTVVVVVVVGVVVAAVVAADVAVAMVAVTATAADTATATTVAAATIGVVVGWHTRLAPWKHCVALDCAVTSTCLFLYPLSRTPVRMYPFLLEETSAFALYFIIGNFPHSRYFLMTFLYLGDFLGIRVN